MTPRGQMILLQNCSTPIINYFCILQSRGRQQEKETLQKCSSEKGETNFIPKIFQFFMQPPVINHFFILHRQEGKE